MKAEINYSNDPGSTSTRNTNEDYLWIGPEEGINAILILDGTSGTMADFGAKDVKTGGRRYVEKFGDSVKQSLSEDSSLELEEVLKSAVKDVWDEFEEEAKRNTERYFDGEGVVLQRACTVPAAVGAIIRWNEETLDLLHVGDVETCIVREEKVENLSNEVHEGFDEIRDEYIDEYGKESKEVDEILRQHRSAHNLPGTYPNMSFNPLAIEKLGEYRSYNIEEVEKILLSTDGATPRIRKLMKPKNNREIINLVENKGADKLIKDLREKEQDADLRQLKTSDDAAIALVKF